MCRNLGPNKVTVEIKTNFMNETDVFQSTVKSDEFQRAFENFPNIFGTFKNMKHNAPFPIPHRKNAPAPLSPPAKAVIADPLMYQIAAYIDKTVALFKIEDINKKVDEFRETLGANLTNHVNAFKNMKLKSLKISLDDIRDSLSAARNTPYPMLMYVSKLIKTNIVIRSKDNVILHAVEYHDNESEAQDKYLALCEVIEESPEAPELSHGFNEVVGRVKAEKLDGMSEQKLKKMLVKELKTLATHLGLQTSKTVDGKRVSLLKDELVAVIVALMPPKA